MKHTLALLGVMACLLAAWVCGEAGLYLLAGPGSRQQLPDLKSQMANYKTKPPPLPPLRKQDKGSPSSNSMSVSAMGSRLSPQSAAASAAEGLAFRLEWDRVSNVPVANYLVLLGQASGLYTNAIWARTNALVVSSLATGQWFFVLCAVGENGLMSDPSVEVTFTNRTRTFSFTIEESDDAETWRPFTTVEIPATNRMAIFRVRMEK